MLLFDQSQGSKQQANSCQTREFQKMVVIGINGLIKHENTLGYTKLSMVDLSNYAQLSANTHQLKADE